MTNYRCGIYLALLVAGGVFSGCDDIIEPDITMQQVVLLSPADSSVSTSRIQTFRWEAVEGAREYRIQLANPSFQNPSTFLLDSVTNKPSFAVALAPGTYHWRVQATNDSYKTPYASRTVRIDSTGSLAGQQFLLLQPANGAVTNNTVLTFAWSPLPMAERYIFNLSPNPRGTAASFDTILAATGSVLLRLPKQSRTYRWKITALNSFSTRESATQSVELDVTAPAYSVFSAPADNSFFLGLPITLTWNRSGTDVIRDSVYLYGANKQTLITSFPQASSGTSLTLSAGTNQLQPGTYYWALRSFDRAGNRSPLSGLRSFVVQ